MIFEIVHHLSYGHVPPKQTHITNSSAGRRVASLLAILALLPLLAGCPPPVQYSRVADYNIDFAEFTLDMQVTGMGSVAPDPAPLRVEGNLAYYTEGTELTLTATPDSGYAFVDWDANGCTTTLTAAEITITMEDNHICIANFAPVTSGVAPVSRIVVSPSTTVDAGTMITLDGSTSSDADGDIVAWDWDFDSDGTVDASGETVTTSFSSPGLYDVSLTVTDNDALTGLGAAGITVNDPNLGTSFTVLVSVSGPGLVDVEPLGRTLPDSDCDGDDCYLSGLPAGTELTLTAAASTPAAFLGWVAEQCDSEPTPDQCVVNVRSNRSIQATFQ
ncbi:MAG: PKD domain-containing protein [Pseudomonadota bacterium]